MAEFQNTIDLLGDNVVARKMIDKTIGEYSDNVLTGVGTQAFAFCEALTSVNLPSVTSIGDGAFIYSTMRKAELANLGIVKSFNYCLSLSEVVLRKATEIQREAFNADSRLETVVLGGSTMCNLSDINAFNNTPFAAGKAGGTVYVPQALITQYQNATNWSTLYAAGTCNFVAIEGSEYE